MNGKIFTIILICLFIVDFILIGMAHSYNMQASYRYSKYNREDMEARVRNIDIILTILNFPAASVLFVMGKFWNLDPSDLAYKTGPFEPFFGLFFYGVLFIIQVWIYYKCYLYILKWKVKRRGD